MSCKTCDSVIRIIVQEPPIVPGPIGPQGVPGPEGNSIIGPQGVAGPQGISIVGPSGVPGPQGSQGPQGNSVVGPSGVPGPQGVQGPQGNSIVGPSGVPGPQGGTPTFQGGVITTLSPGSSATGSVVPSSPGSTLYNINLGIPSGPAGPTGPIGPGSIYTNTANSIQYPVQSAPLTNTANGLTAFGVNAAHSIGTGADNSVFGVSSGQNLANGASNAFFGYQSGQNISGSLNVALGANALQGVTGSGNGTNRNVVVGASAAPNISSDNAIVGYNVLGIPGSSPTLVENSILGSSSARVLNNGGQNVFVGYNVAEALTTGQGNVFLGSAVSNTVTIVNNGIAIGNRSSVGANSNIAIGSFTTDAGLSNCIVIGPNLTATNPNTVLAGLPAATFNTDADFSHNTQLLIAASSGNTYGYTRIPLASTTGDVGTPDMSGFSASTVPIYFGQAQGLDNNFYPTLFAYINSTWCAPTYNTSVGFVYWAPH